MQKEALRLPRSKNKNREKENKQNPRNASSCGIGLKILPSSGLGARSHDPDVNKKTLERLQNSLRPFSRRQRNKSNVSAGTTPPPELRRSPCSEQPTPPQPSPSSQHHLSTRGERDIAFATSQTCQTYNTRSLSF